MGNYYYLASLLQPLEFPSRPDISFSSLQEGLSLNLSKKDLKKVQALRLFVDLCNIRPLLLEEEIDTRGNLGEKDLEEALLGETFFPEYVFDFLKEHDNLIDKLRAFPALLSRFFQEETEMQEGFLKKYFEFERQWRLVVLAIRAKATKRDFLRELQFEDLHDPFVMQILAQKDVEQYVPPSEYKEIQDLLLACGPDPWQQYKSLSLYRFNQIGRMVGNSSLFSIDSILAYLAQLMIVEYWNELSSERGRVILDTLKTS